MKTPYLVWYLYGLRNELWCFDDFDQARDWQLDPTGRAWLGDKLVVYVVFRPDAARQYSSISIQDLLDQVFTVQDVWVLPGPETPEQSVVRLAKESRLKEEAKAKAAALKAEEEAQLPTRRKKA